MGSTHEVKQEEISYGGSMHSSLEAWYSQVDLVMDYVACIDETTAGPVSPNTSCLYGGYVSRPLICYR